MKSLVGIYSRASDDHLERVIHELQRRQVPWIRFDTADFPQLLRLSARFDPNAHGWYGDFTLSSTRYRLQAFQSLWYRRPTKRYAFPDGLSETGYEYARAEAHKGFGGLLYALEACWVSHPDAIRAAEWKPKQLAYASQVGLTVPKTLITNDVQAAFQFFEECQGEMVYKPFNQGVPRPKPGAVWQGAIYTTKMTRAVLEQHASSLPLTANLFQEYIAKQMDLRIIVIGTRVFAAEIHSQQSQRAQVDFRLAYDELHYAVHQLPDVVHQQVLALVRAFDLQFSSMDILLTPEGEYVFLDLNPCGQWGWIERHTGLPLTEALVDLLTCETDN